MRTFCLLALSLSLALSPTSARAQGLPTPTDKLTGEAKASYHDALLLFGNGDHAGALVKFQAAFDSSQDARLLWNMAACAKSLRRYVAAIRMLQQYLESPSILEADKQQARELVAIMSSFVTDLHVDVTEPGATVYVDDEVIGKTPHVEHTVDLGKHTVRVEKAGFSPFERKVVARGSDRLVVTVRLERPVLRGKLSIVTDTNAIIHIDSHVVGTGHWEGTLEAGAHRVELTAQGKRSYVANVVIHDKESRSLESHLDPVAKPSNMTWLWVTGSVALASGLAVGSYFLFRRHDEIAEPLCGLATIPPYCLTVGR